MLTAQDYGKIRRAEREGMSIREMGPDVSSFPTEDTRDSPAVRAERLHPAAESAGAGAGAVSGHD